MPMTRLAPTAFAVALALTSPALAQVSAQQLWQDARTLLATEGIDLTAREDQRGDALALLRPRIAFPEGGAIQLPDITLRELPGGAVQVELPPQFPLVLDLPPDNGPAPDQVSLTVSAPGFALVLRSLGAMASDFDLTAPSLTATLDPVDMPTGANGEKGDLFLALALADLSLKHRHDADPARMGADSALNLGTIHAEARFDVPDEAAKGSFSLDLSAIAGHVKGQIPPEAESTFAQAEAGQDPEFAAFIDLLDKGMALDAGLSHGPVALAIDAEPAREPPFTVTLSSSNGSFDIALDRTGLLYDVLSGRSRLFMEGKFPDLPLPQLEVSLDTYRTMLRLGLPGGGTWGSQTNSGATGPNGPLGWGEWAAEYRIAGLAVSAALWDLFDPGQIIPRDPLSLVASATGSYTLDPAVLEPGWQSTPDSPPPFQEITVKLAEVLVAGAGASVSGSGNVALDFTAMQTAHDTPRANGSLSFVTMGANALLDRLSSLGVLSKDDLMGARMGLMFIGKLEGGADRLVTKLDFAGESFSLNGQKIR